MKVAVVGAAGRMGRAVLREAERSDDIEVTGCIESRSSRFIGRSLRELAGPDSPPVAITPGWSEAMNGTEVLIDFSSPEGTECAMEMSREHHLPLVCGTTGLPEEVEAGLRLLAETEPVFYAPNMSIGIHLMSTALRTVAAVLPDGWDAEVVEVHHTAKKDAPSGTALMLSGILRGRGTKGAGAGGRGTPIHSLRAGDLPGRHSILLAGRGEALELSHAVHDRATFASGALRAARFLVGKGKGWYGMADMFPGPNAGQEGDG
jgi:4-hydroxy-tetrahydrodipicolinate reductase